MSRNGKNAQAPIPFLVAPREGCVSRNLQGLVLAYLQFVAPREGCVSRNFINRQH